MLNLKIKSKMKFDHFSNFEQNDADQEYILDQLFDQRFEIYSHDDQFWSLFLCLHTSCARTHDIIFFVRSVRTIA